MPRRKSYRPRTDDVRPSSGFAVDLGGIRYYLNPVEKRALAEIVQALQLARASKEEIERVCEDWLTLRRQSTQWFSDPE